MYHTHPGPTGPPLIVLLQQTQYTMHAVDIEAITAVPPQAIIRLLDDKSYRMSRGS